MIQQQTIAAVEPEYNGTVLSGHPLLAISIKLLQKELGKLLDCLSVLGHFYREGHLNGASREPTRVDRVDNKNV